MTTMEENIKKLREMANTTEHMEVQRAIRPLDTYSLDLSAMEAAELVGCDVVKPDVNQLQLDLDTEEAYEWYKVRVMEFQQHSNFGVHVEEHFSKSGPPKRHITLTLTDEYGNPIELDEWQRITLQFALGSDPIRETLNTWRLLRGEPNPTRLFEPKAKDNNAG